MTLTTLFGIATIGLLSIYLWKSLSTRKNDSAPLPPGPKGKPIVGNLWDLPAPGEKECLHWLKHRDLYGPLSSVTILGQTIIIINDRQLAFEILEKRSAKHSSRPRLVFANELSGWGKAPSNQDNTNLWRAHRKAIARPIGTRAAASKFENSQELEVRRFLWRLLQNPKDFIKHIRTEAGAFILKITYGYSIEPHKPDPLVDLADLGLQQFSKAVVPGAWLVDIIPSLKYLPDWFPGAGFKQIARHYAQTLRDLTEKPFAFTKYQMAHGSRTVSFASDLLENGEDEEIVKWSSLAMYSAGADTTVSALKGFFLAMALYPAVQRKGQAEIDRVVGPGRLPTTADRDNLPYINAIVKELFRWHTIGPLGLPHKSDEDDIVNGFLIPKGATLLTNVWAFNHDPTTHPDPTKFKPERFLPSDGHELESDPYTVGFGFGRRICPGRLIADTAMFLNVAQSLAAFNISKSIGEDGREIEPEFDFTPGVISHVKEYQCTIKPRSPHHEELIRSVEKEHPFEVGDSGILNQVSY